MAFNALMFPKFKWFDDNGDPAASWEINAYEAGTSTRKTTYTSSGGAVENTNPVILSANGEADVFLDGTYKIVLTDADEVVKWTLDNLQGVAIGTITHSVVATLAVIGTGAIDGEERIVAATGNHHTWDDDNSKWRISSGNRYTTAALPAAATFTIETGTTVWDTTTDSLKVWNGTSWRNQTATSAEAETGTDTLKWVTPAGTKASVEEHAPIDNYITGLILSNDTDADHDINITAGLCKDSTNAEVIELAAEITKRIDAAWSVGDDAGGLDTGSVAADTIYSMWVIKRSDTGVVDVLFSLSKTAPTMPTDYDFKRFIGFVWTLDGAATIKPFIMTGTGEIWFTKASQCIVVTAAKTDFTTYAENPVDLSGDLPTGHYDSILFGCQTAATTTVLQISSDGTNTITVGEGNFASIADGELYAWERGVAAEGFKFIPLAVADTIYILATTQDGNNVSLLIHAVKLKHR